MDKFHDILGRIEYSHILFYCSKTQYYDTSICQDHWCHSKDVQELTVNEAEVTCYNNEMEQNEINDKMELRTEAPFRDQNSREHFFDAVENLAVRSRYEKLVVNPAETVPRDATDCDRIGRGKPKRIVLIFIWN